MPRDMIFRGENFIFSYRVGGLLFHEKKVLLQRTVGSDFYGIPGGHVAFGETTEETLAREFYEEMGAEITIRRLVLVGENFFPWADRTPCQQISFYYEVELVDEKQIPLEGSFRAVDEMEGQLHPLEFCWMPLDQLREITLYPVAVAKELSSLPEGVKHFVVRE